MMKLVVKVSAGARRNEVLGWEANYPGVGRVLKLKIAAPPVEGRANKAIESFLASLLHLPKNSVRIVQGTSAHIKLITLPDNTNLRILSQ